MTALRRERRIAHEWRAAQYHTHERIALRPPFRIVSVRCTKANCRKEVSK